MRKSLLVGIGVAVLASYAPAASADHIVVNVLNQKITMEGRMQKTEGPVKTLHHDKFNVNLNLYLAGDGKRRGELVYIEKVYPEPSRREQYQRELAKAKKGGAAERMDAAEWAVRRGMTKEFYECLDLVIEADANHALAKKLIALRQLLDADLPTSDAEEKTLSKEIGPGFKFKKSKHYILAYDTAEKRANERVELLERVYETFFMFFTLKGLQLEKPQQLMMVVLFNQHKNYEDFSLRLSPDLKSAAGYWSPETNIAVFFDQGTHPAFAAINEITEKLEAEKKEAERTKKAGRGDLVRISDSLKLLKLVAQENQDVEVVSHEGLHQVAGNSGLFPRYIRIPRWVHEGLAAYFEAPADASWSGVGQANQERLEFYRVLADHDRVHSNVDFIISDHIYDKAGGHIGNVLHAYGQAWAMTHFLIDKHFKELAEYWKSLARMPADMLLGEEILRQTFNAAFGSDHNALDQEWRRHMNGIQTELDKIKEDKKG